MRNSYEILIVIGLSTIVLIVFLLEFTLRITGVAASVIALSSLILSLLVYLIGPRVQGPKLEIIDTWLHDRFRVDEKYTRIDEDKNELEGRTVVHIFIQNRGDQVGYFRLDDAKVITKDQVLSLFDFLWFVFFFCYCCNTVLSISRKNSMNALEVSQATLKNN